MKYAAIVNKARKLLGGMRTFARAKFGNTAVIFALTIIPLMIAGGAGIDLTRSLAARNAMQAALDAASLAVATSNPPPEELSQAQREQIAQDYFDANYHLDASFGTPTPVQVVVTSSTAVVTSTLAVPTTLMRVALIDDVPLNSSSTSTWGQTKLWVSLVLDNTGSMCEPGSQPCPTPDANSKMAALKTATHQLLTILEGAAAHDGDVQVAIIPFSKDVNAGASNYSASWIDWTAWDNKNGSCSISGNNTRTSCESATTGSCNGPHSTQTGCTTKGTCTIGTNDVSKSTCEGRTSGVCSISGNTTQSTCEAASTGWCSNPGQTSESSCTGSKACPNASYTTKTSCNNALGSGSWGYGTWHVSSHGVWTTTATGVWTQYIWTVVNGVWTVNNHNTWGGCVMDRGDSGAPSSPAYDTTNTAPGASTASKFPAEQYSSCPQSILPLTYDWDDLSDKVDDMTSAGNTNQTIGLAWGWHAITDGDPLNPGTLPGNTTPIIILMTDGLNTQNRWSSTQATIDGRMASACANFKAWQYDSTDTSKRPILYTIQVDVGGTDGVSTTLQNCASGTTKYYHLTTAGATVTVFNQIATEITNMRVSQ